MDNIQCNIESFQWSSIYGEQKLYNIVHESQLINQKSDLSVTGQNQLMRSQSYSNNAA